MLDWSTKDSKTESGFFEWLFKIFTTFLHLQTHKALRISFASNLVFLATRRWLFLANMQWQLLSASAEMK